MIRKTENRLRIYLGLCAALSVILCACAPSSRTDEELKKSKTAPVIQEEEPRVLQTEYERSVILQPVETEFTRTETGVFFGNISIRLSQDTQAEAVTLEDGSRVLRFSEEDPYALLSGEFYLRRYTADWIPEEDLNALIKSIMEVTGAGSVDRTYWDADTGEAALRCIHDNVSYEILIKNEDIYLAWMVTSPYLLSFRELLTDYLIRWEDTGMTAQGGSAGQAACYIKVTEQEDIFFVEIEEGMASIYDYQHPKEPMQVLTGDDINYVHWQEILADINFDGYTDLLLYKSRYLYDAPTGRFVKAEFPEEMYYSDTHSFKYFGSRYFTEEKTIWGYYSENWYSSSEYLWQWEGNALVLRREIRIEEGEDEVRLIAQDAEEGILFEFSVKLGDESYPKYEAIELKPYYEQFYEGYVPGDTYYVNHRTAEEAEQIPEELLSYLERAVVSGTELESLSALVNYREVTDDELREIAGTNPDVRADISSAIGWGGYAFITADGDNDGISDLIGNFDSGGSFGECDFIFYQGQEDGTFLCTDIYGHIREEFATLNWEGRTYFCFTTFDYSKKRWDGLRILYYEDGVRTEGVWIKLLPDSYTFELTGYADAGYKKWAEALLTPEVCAEIYRLTEKDEMYMGGAEIQTLDSREVDIKYPVGGLYECDLNNDGIAESYAKEIWYTSSMNSQDHLSFECEEAPIVEEAVWNRFEAGMPIMMWVEDYEGKNIVIVMYRTGLYDYRITGYLVKGDAYAQVFSLNAKASYSTEREYYRYYTGPGLYLE